MKYNRRLLGYTLLFTTALIWGLAFVVQYKAGSYIDAISLNGIRYALATIFMGIVFLVYYLIKKKKGTNYKYFSKDAWLWGILAGIALFLGNNTQQWGLNLTCVANSSFITTLYVVLVPIVALLTRKKPLMVSLYAMPIAVLGFWLICVKDNFVIAFGDLISFISAMCFTIQIIFIGLAVRNHDPYEVTFIQFLTAAVISIPVMAINGFPSGEAVSQSIWLILYIGIMSAGVGFLFQSIGQSMCEQSVASIIMSLESVFALILATIILHEEHTSQELLGCLFVFIAVYIAQIEKHPKLLQNKSKYIEKTLHRR